MCHEHGGDISECGHKVWYPHREVCWPAAALAAANARYDALHEDQPYHDGTFQRWSEKRGGAFQFHYRDGVTITVHREDLSPGEDFLTRG